jgi:hypothetical protein
MRRRRSSLSSTLLRTVKLFTKVVTQDCTLEDHAVTVPYMNEKLRAIAFRFNGRLGYFQVSTAARLDHGNDKTTPMIVPIITSRFDYY